MVKGDVARALLYMAIRYMGDAINEPQLSLTDRTDEIVSGNTVMGRYTTLVKWHFADPVSAVEQARNDAVFAYQANRNPFIDHPEWVATAFIPPVRIARNGRNLTLCWTNDYAPSVIPEQSTNLASAWLIRHKCGHTHRHKHLGDHSSATSRNPLLSPTPGMILAVWRDATAFDVMPTS